MSQQKMRKSLVAHYTVRKDLWQHKKANLAPLRKPEITSLKKKTTKKTQGKIIIYYPMLHRLTLK